MADTRRRPGPKPRGPFQNKRLTLTTRITEDLRKKLEAAAEDSGRSLSQEIELRLIESFTAAESLATAERLAASANRALDVAEEVMERGQLLWTRGEAVLAKVQELLGPRDRGEGDR